MPPPRKIPLEITTSASLSSTSSSTSPVKNLVTISPVSRTRRLSTGNVELPVSPTHRKKADAPITPPHKKMDTSTDANTSPSIVTSNSTIYSHSSQSNRVIELSTPPRRSSLSGLSPKRSNELGHSPNSSSNKSDSSAISSTIYSHSSQSKRVMELNVPTRRPSLTVNANSNTNTNTNNNLDYVAISPVGKSRTFNPKNSPKVETKSPKYSNKKESDYIAISPVGKSRTFNPTNSPKIDITSPSKVRTTNSSASEFVAISPLGRSRTFNPTNSPQSTTSSNTSHSLPLSSDKDKNKRLQTYIATSPLGKSRTFKPSLPHREASNSNSDSASQSSRIQAELSFLKRDRRVATSKSNYEDYDSAPDSPSGYSDRQKSSMSSSNGGSKRGGSCSVESVRSSNSSLSSHVYNGNAEADADVDGNGHGIVASGSCDSSTSTSTPADEHEENEDELDELDEIVTSLSQRSAQTSSANPPIADTDVVEPPTTPPRATKAGSNIVATATTSTPTSNSSTTNNTKSRFKSPSTINDDATFIEPSSSTPSFSSTPSTTVSTSSSLPHNVYKVTLHRRRKKPPSFFHLNPHIPPPPPTEIYDPSLGLILILPPPPSPPIPIIRKVVSLAGGFSSPAQKSGLLKRGDCILSVNGFELLQGGGGGGGSGGTGGFEGVIGVVRMLQGVVDDEPGYGSGDATSLRLRKQAVVYAPEEANLPYYTEHLTLTVLIGEGLPILKIHEANLKVAAANAGVSNVSNSNSSKSDYSQQNRSPHPGRKSIPSDNQSGKSSLFSQTASSRHNVKFMASSSYYEQARFSKILRPSGVGKTKRESSFNDDDDDGDDGVGKMNINTSINLSPESQVVRAKVLKEGSERLKVIVDMHCIDLDDDDDDDNGDGRGESPNDRLTDDEDDGNIDGVSHSSHSHSNSNSRSHSRRGSWPFHHDDDYMKNIIAELEERQKQSGEGHTTFNSSDLLAETTSLEFIKRVSKAHSTLHEAQANQRLALQNDPNSITSLFNNQFLDVKFTSLPPPLLTNGVLIEFTNFLSSASSASASDERRVDFLNAIFPIWLGLFTPLPSDRRYILFDEATTVRNQNNVNGQAKVLETALSSPSQSSSSSSTSKANSNISLLNTNEQTTKTFTLCLTSALSTISSAPSTALNKLNSFNPNLPYNGEADYSFEIEADHRNQTCSLITQYLKEHIQNKTFTDDESSEFVMKFGAYVFIDELLEVAALNKCRCTVDSLLSIAEFDAYHSSFNINDASIDKSTLPLSIITTNLPTLLCTSTGITLLVSTWPKLCIWQVCAAQYSCAIFDCYWRYVKELVGVGKGGGEGVERFVCACVDVEYDDEDGDEDGDDMGYVEQLTNAQLFERLSVMKTILYTTKNETNTLLISRPINWTEVLKILIKGCNKYESNANSELDESILYSLLSFILDVCDELKPDCDIRNEGLEFVAIFGLEDKSGDVECMHNRRELLERALCQLFEFTSADNKDGALSSTPLKSFIGKVLTPEDEEGDDEEDEQDENETSSQSQSERQVITTLLLDSLIKVLPGVEALEVLRLFEGLTCDHEVFVESLKKILFLSLSLNVKDDGGGGGGVKGKIAAINNRKKNSNSNNNNNEVSLALMRIKDIGRSSNKTNTNAKVKVEEEGRNEGGGTKRLWDSF